MDRKKIFSLSLDIAQNLIKYGAEISRAEETVKRINTAHGNECYVFALPTLIIAQCGEETQIRRIKPSETNLSELVRLNSISRRLCFEKNREPANIGKHLYPIYIDIISIFASSAFFSLYFGGNVTDALFSGITGLVISYSGSKMIRLPQFSSNLVSSFIAGALSFIPQKFGMNVQPDKIIIGTIMMLVPGLTVVNAIRDMMNSDLVAGIIELADAVMSALGIAFGVAGALILMNII